MTTQIDRLNAALCDRDRVERFVVEIPAANATRVPMISRYVMAQNWFTDLKRLTNRTKQ